MTKVQTAPIGRRDPVAPRPGFRHRHRWLSLLLALHLPALVSLALVAGHAVPGVLAAAAVVLLALTVAVVVETSSRVRVLGLVSGLVACSVAVGLLTSSLAWGLLHAAVSALLVAVHLGAAWRGTGTSWTGGGAAGDHAEVAPGGDAGTAAVAPGGGAGTAAVTPADPAGDADVVEVRDVYTGVWSARRLVPPRTRLLRLPEAEAAGPQGPGPDDTADADVGDHPRPDAEPEAPAGRRHEERDPDLTREVLHALHVSATSDGVGKDA